MICHEEGRLRLSPSTRLPSGKPEPRFSPSPFLGFPPHQVRNVGYHGGFDTMSNATLLASAFEQSLFNSARAVSCWGFSRAGLLRGLLDKNLVRLKKMDDDSFRQDGYQ